MDNVNINFKLGKYLCLDENPQLYVDWMKSFINSKDCKGHNFDFRFYMNAKVYVELLNKTAEEVCNHLDIILNTVMKDMPEDVKDAFKSDWINIDRYIFYANEKAESE